MLVELDCTGYEHIGRRAQPRAKRCPAAAGISRSGSGVCHGHARFSPRVDPSREANPTGLVGTILQVEVRNACGADGIAAQTTQYLRRHGFDVVEVGDHTSFSLETSQVIDRVGDLEAAKKVAAALGIDGVPGQLKGRRRRCALLLAGFRGGLLRGSHRQVIRK